LHIHLQPVQKISEIPVDNYPLAAAIYRLLESVVPEYAAFLHHEGYAAEAGWPEEFDARESSKRFKFFVFSRLAQREKRIVGDRIRLNDSLVTWQIASPIDEMMGALAEGLVSAGQFTIADRKSNATFAIDGIEIEEAPRIGNRLRGETISPIFVAVTDTEPDGRRVKHHVRAEEERFGPCLAANLCEKYLALTGMELEDEVGFRFLERPRSQLAQFNGTDHKCYMGRVELVGNPVLLRLAWESGLGAANSKGFGMIRAL
jgi:CRISPR-associated endoribonuclease Cas6